MIKIQQTLLLLSILSISACTIPEKKEVELQYERYESKQIQCGQEQIKVVSYCFDPEDGLVDRGSGGIIRECKSSKILIGSSKVLNLPILKQDVNKAYRPRILKEGNLSLISFYCIQADKQSYLILNQGVTNNANVMSEGDKKKFSIPVVLDTKGNFVQERNRILKNSKYKKSQVVSANAVYGVN